MIKIVKNEEPLVVECLSEVIETARKRKLQGLCMVYIIDDKIYTDYVKGDGTSITELIGCVEVMRTELIEAMRL